MAAKAYFMVTVADKYLKDGYKTIMADLNAVPEVKSAERVSGTSDLMMQVEIPLSSWTVFAADKLLAKKWVKRLQVISVEPLVIEKHPEECEEAILDAERR